MWWGEAPELTRDFREGSKRFLTENAQGGEFAEPGALSSYKQTRLAGMITMDEGTSWEAARQVNRRNRRVPCASSNALVCHLGRSRARPTSLGCQYLPQPRAFHRWSSGARVGIAHDFIAKATNAAISPW